MTATALKLETDLVSHLPYLRSLAMHLCGRHDDASDLVQEAIERGLRWARTLPSDSNLKAWLRRVLWNIFIDGWRRQAREALELAANLDDVPANDDEGEPQPRWAALDGTQLRAAMDSLDAPFRAVYQLHAEGHDYQTIARRLGLPKATVGTRLHRARKKLRAVLETGHRRAAADSA